MSQPIASLSLDLDNKWSYMKIHGDPGWEEFPSYLDTVVPRILDFCESLEFELTVFVVGQDACLAKNRASLASIARAGHEIGNHSFGHEPRLHLYPEQRIEADLASAEKHIHKVCGQRPVGFRGPGYGVSAATARVLAHRGYLYDASTLPTFLGPLARAYYLATSGLNRQEKKQRDVLFGKLRDGFKPLKPHRWRIAGGELLEIPVTTMPLLKLPIHFSYLLYLARFSRRLALFYFRTALAMCRIARVEPSLLLHPLDFLGCDDEPELAFFPAMDVPAPEKIQLVREVVVMLRRRYRLVNMAEHARQAESKSAVPGKTFLGRHSRSLDKSGVYP